MVFLKRNTTIDESNNHNESARDFRRPSDSFLTKIFARSLSVHLTPLLSKTKVTPLQVTIFSLFVGLSAAYFGSKNYWGYCLAAAFSREIAHILDCMDGELARLTDRGNPFAAAMDPICDRILDISVLYAGFIQLKLINNFNLSETQVASIAFFTVSLWIFYQYIVDAHINPVRQKKVSQMPQKKEYHVYFGLYDLFIYGSILFWIFHIFEYFLFYVLFLSIVGLFIQIIKLYKLHSINFNR